jgi:hypothetical protein
MTPVNSLDFFLSTVRNYLATSSSSAEGSLSNTETAVEDMEVENSPMPMDSDVPNPLDLPKNIAPTTTPKGCEPRFQPIVDLATIVTLDLTAGEGGGENDARNETANASGSSDSDIEIVKPKPCSKEPTLAQRLRHPVLITIPQVLGKGAYSNPWLIDSFIATPALKEALDAGTNPRTVVWASFLKNNGFFLDSGNACDIMQTWLDGTDPHRYKHITKLAFDDFLSHSNVRMGQFNTNSITTYRPFRLVAKCPNLTRLLLQFDIATLPGMRNGYFKHLDIADMEDGFDKRFRMGELFSKASKTLRAVELNLTYHRRWVYGLKKGTDEMWMEAIQRYFVRKAVEAGRGRVKILTQYEEYSTRDNED